MSLTAAAAGPNVVEIRGFVPGDNGRGANVVVTLQPGATDGHVRTLVNLSGTSSALWSTGVAWSVVCADAGAGALFWAPWDGSSASASLSPLRPIAFPNATAISWPFGATSSAVSVPLAALLNASSDTGLVLALAPTT